MKNDLIKTLMTFGLASPTVRFNNPEDGGDGGGGGDQQKAEKPTEKTADQNKDTATHLTKEAGKARQAGLADDDLVPVTIDGVEKTMTVAELRDAASKSMGAEKKFDEAARLRKDAESDRRAVELLKKAAAGQQLSSAEQSELSGYVGVDSLDQLLAGRTDDRDRKDAAKADQKKTIGMDDLDPDLKELLQNVAGHTQSEQNASLRQMVETDIKKELDSDKGFAKMVENLDEDRRKVVSEALFDIVNDKVKTVILTQERYGPDVIKDCIQTARSLVQKVGIQTGEKAGQPKDSGNDYYRSVVAGLGPTLGINDTDMSSNKPIERSSSTDENKYYDNFVARVFQSLAGKKTS